MRFAKTLLGLAVGLGLISTTASASTVNVVYTGTINSGGIDTDNIFGLGTGTDLTGLTATFTVTLSSGASFGEECGAGGACWFDQSGGGLLTETMTVAGGNTVSLTDTSTAPLSYSASGNVTLDDPADLGASNFFYALTYGADAVTNLSVANYLTGAVNIDAYGTGTGAFGVGTSDAAFSTIEGAVANDGIGTGSAFQFKNGDETIVATMTGASAPEPATTTLLGGALVALGLLRGRARRA